MNFKKEIRKDHTIIVVELKSATIEHTEQFKALFEELLVDEIKNIIVDLTPCEFIDSTFMGLLVRCHKDLQRVEGQLKIVCTGKVKFLLHDVTHLSSVIELYETRKDAFNSHPIE